MARVIFDLDGTIIGDVGGRHVIRKGMLEVIRARREKGDTVILWTFGNRAWWNKVKEMFPILGIIFDEVYTKDELPGHMTRGPGGPHRVKDIRVLAGDVLVDNDESHHAWARRHGLDRQYVKVRTLGSG